MKRVIPADDRLEFLRPRVQIRVVPSILVLRGVVLPSYQTGRDVNPAFANKPG